MTESMQKTAFISGGTSGIGLAAAEILLERGWNVVVSGRSAERGKAALEYLNAGSRAVYMGGDVGNDEDCRCMIDETVRQFGRLDGLVTSAGYYEECLLEYTVDEQVRQMFAVNVYGTISLCRYALPYLKKTCGSIVTVSSDAGLQGNVACSVYGATKGPSWLLRNPWRWRRRRIRYGSTASAPATWKRRSWKSSCKETRP